MTTTDLEPPTRCRSCNAWIWWKVNPSGKRQPFDYDDQTHERTTMPHHATCPQGRAWQLKEIDPKLLEPKPDIILERARLKVALAKISYEIEEALKLLD